MWSRLELELNSNHALTDENKAQGEKQIKLFLSDARCRRMGGKRPACRKANRNANCNAKQKCVAQLAPFARASGHTLGGGWE